jgi:hypothetical protein
MSRLALIAVALAAALLGVALGQESAYSADEPKLELVRVESSEEDPVWTRDLDHPPRPFQARVFVEVPSDTESRCTHLEVPGELLVIETISARVQAGAGEGIEAYVSTVVDGVEAEWALPLSRAVEGSVFGRLGGTEAVRLYAEGTAKACLLHDVASPSGVSGSVFVSGHVIPRS